MPGLPCSSFSLREWPTHSTEQENRDRVRTVHCLTGQITNGGAICSDVTIAPRHNVTGSNFEIVMSCLDGAPDGMLIFEVFVAALLVDHLDLRHVCQLAQCCKLATRRFHEPISLAAMPSVKCYGPNDA